ncbi:MAG TPA: hypothetical protein VF483_07920, partial [Gemmatimonadaceae bacterium]
MTRTMVPRLLAPLAALLLAGCKDTSGPTTPLITLGRRLTAGEQTACALTPTGAAYCWGLSSSFWEFGGSPNIIAGGGTPAGADVRTLAALARGVGNHFCAFTVSNAGVCWGRGSNGQLGNGETDVGNPPAIMDSGIVWQDITVGRLTSCGVSQAGAGYCWGLNQSGEIGDSLIATG